MNKVFTVIVIILAVVGALALFGALGMGTMHASMMGGGALGWILAVLLLMGIIAAAVFVFGSRRK